MAVKIHIITGWQLPPADFLDILIDQFSKKLLEDYPQLNVDEVEYAFRSIGTGVKDWGKSMNLSLIDEVLREYCNTRFELSQQEERATDKPVQKLYTQEQLDNMHREDIENFYQRCLRGITPPRELPEYYKEILVKDRLIHPDSNDLHAFFAWNLNNGSKNIYVEE